MPEPILDMQPGHWAIVQDILRRHVADCEVWAFGSRARGGAKTYSDLDLALVADQALPIARIAALHDAFDESDLPWRVDIVEWASTNDEFRRIIARDKVVVQTRNIT